MAPDAIKKLVTRFIENRDSYSASTYNETQLRREFLDPFFEALGWDISNKQGYAEAYKEVIHEDAVKVGTATKAPDYSFRVGGTRKFFVEAKKPFVNIKEDISPAFQLRRYAWSAKLPLSILTDFEEFSVYDCRVKPVKTDKAGIGRILYIRFDEYEKRWDEIASIFSKGAVLKGSFDRYAETNRAKKGTSEVDDAFLVEIEAWRDLLARNIALRNGKLSPRNLNFAVQRTIDRLIFLRICEDRGIEDYGRLLSHLNGVNIYKRLCVLFREADERYNSGLFHFREEKGREETPDEITLKLDIDDKVLKQIIRNLYYPDSAYEFSVLPADILGQVYEQFLGKVIRLTAGHQAKVEDKPEVKKAGGVFYTPTYIVDYIVKNTVGKLLENKTPKQAASLRILDPACGSGSFLIGAYRYLLDWHCDWYTDNNPEKRLAGKNPAIYQARAGEYRLTTPERKKILTNNIYGVDIDSQAVEVTKLSLLLKVLEGENEQTIAQQMKLFHERALPDLGNNIKCGNSLIGTDYYRVQGVQETMSLYEDEESEEDKESARVNAFDWDGQFGFREIMKNGGFDAVIGNPPYSYKINENEQEYYNSKYKCQDYQKDLYLLFFERYADLIKEKGILGVIVSNTWLQSVTYKNIRRYLMNEYRWLKILHLPEKVFKAVVDTHVLVFERRKNFIPKNEMVEIEIKEQDCIRPSHRLKLKELSRNGESINIVATRATQKLYRKILNASKPLSDFCDIYNGIKPFEKGKGMPPQTADTMRERPFVKEGARPGKKWSPLLRGSLINRYRNLWNDDYWILYGEWLAAPRDKTIFEAPEKLMVRQTGDSIIGTSIEGTFFARNNMHILLPKNGSYDLRYLLAFLNSTTMDFCYSIMNPEKGEALAEVKKQHVERLPISPIDFSAPSEKKIHDNIVSMVSSLLTLNKKLPRATGQGKVLIERQIESIDRRIDELVYELYGLTEEEIGIVEGDERK
ncbi:MAG: N-6 DNA methylase [Chitinispirillaceae bacterium]|nr:N-6 DNA methylase [Chitinispirillaceae bacterium]